MRHIKSFNEVNGTELVGNMGPAYGNTKLDRKLPNIGYIYHDLSNKIYTEDEYLDIYNEYLKMGGTPLFGFSLDNLNKVLNMIKKEIIE